jgi:hypothetical protein
MIILNVNIPRVSTSPVALLTSLYKCLAILVATVSCNTKQDGVVRFEQQQGSASASLVAAMEDEADRLLAKRAKRDLKQTSPNFANGNSNFFVECNVLYGHKLRDADRQKQVDRICQVECPQREMQAVIAELTTYLDAPAPLPASAGSAAIAETNAQIEHIRSMKCGDLNLRVRDVKTLARGKQPIDATVARLEAEWAALCPSQR